MNRSFILAVCLLMASVGTLLAAQPWIDHFAGQPTPQAGGYDSAGEFHVPAGYTLVQLRLIAYGEDPTGILTETVVPAGNIQLALPSGTWSTFTPSPSGPYRVLGVLVLQDNTTGEFRSVCTDASLGQVMVP